MRHRMQFESPIGTICLEDDGEALTALYLRRENDSRKEQEPEDAESELLRKAEQELAEYFAGKRKEFDLPLHLKGTEFQRKVWEALRQIPYGQTRSYSEIAQAIGNPKAVRAVGGANNKNPIMLFVPCHRVIGKDGSLVGFAGGLEVKKYLLELEAGKREQ